ncbi:MAG: hypothetical protein H6538_02950 [Bacteroidales bacterium]|nr:hypothetical protein [Bacteroidales bacterium]MCB8999688.1 hypothetical protein [Bacteroidales bacterium]
MFLTRILQLFRYFSLDIIIGAIASLVFASSVMGVVMPRPYYIILGLTVWLIYTADHLMDGVKTRGKSESDTHNFFYKYKIPIILVFLLVLVFNFRLVMYRLDEKFIEFGFAPALAVVVYLVLNRYYGDAPRYFFIKEVWIALIYTIAIWGGPFIMANDLFTPASLLTMLSFFLLIFGNVLIYSIYERDKDEKDNNRSLVRDFGLRMTINLALAGLILAILSAIVVYVFMGGALMHMLTIMLIAGPMLLILSYPEFFTRGKLYGIVADLLIWLFFLSLIG